MARPKKVEVAEAEESTEQVQEFKPITAEEQAIAARVSGDLGDWGTFGEDSVLDYSLGRDIFALPEPAKKKQDNKEFAFRWITRTTERLDQIRNKAVPFKWWICNRVNTPFLEGYFDPVLGCVSCEDQMLVFKPWWMRDKEVAYKRGLADAQDHSGHLLNKDGQMRDGVEFQAGKRTLDGRDLGRREVRGDDMIMADEGVMDERAGVRHEEGISDLIVDE